MGAPGKARFCQKGHLFEWIGEGSDDETRENSCPCGQETALNIAHYGDVNDCQETPLKKVGEEVLLSRVQNLVDRNGEPLEGYVPRTFEVWDVSSFS
ncbi:MAG: hypothetical protein A2719_02595 [Candidatus Ryanbacteria bacterium RIFCSPHIGHO2_01_FULL_45_22]|uniref:Uncharacterized protein n=1 Tax=Candidatus Ryanbacteria bacterium RIFCSPHIGHO2_01_FULL_45_22 TaxID=1802114 RepID=A0A1G2G1U7_9BACT|nr:MAG: hypothetical protein A2719_02595 [Candidatus Ryanbacteria bacterium RIFCSPHIGHO2_01_FULL_45_22]